MSKTGERAGIENARLQRRIKRLVSKCNRVEDKLQSIIDEYGYIEIGYVARLKEENDRLKEKIGNTVDPIDLPRVNAVLAGKRKIINRLEEANARLKEENDGMLRALIGYDDILKSARAIASEISIEHVAHGGDVLVPRKTWVELRKVLRLYKGGDHGKHERSRDHGEDRSRDRHEVKEPETRDAPNRFCPAGDGKGSHSWMRDGDDVITCRRCGVPMNDVYPWERASTTKEIPSHEWTCNLCGATLPEEDAEECPKCGGIPTRSGKPPTKYYKDTYFQAMKERETPPPNTNHPLGRLKMMDNAIKRNFCGDGKGGKPEQSNAMKIHVGGRERKNGKGGISPLETFLCPKCGGIQWYKFGYEGIFDSNDTCKCENNPAVAETPYICPKCGKPFYNDKRGKIFYEDHVKECKIKIPPPNAPKEHDAPGDGLDGMDGTSPSTRHSNPGNGKGGDPEPMHPLMKREFSTTLKSVGYDPVQAARDYAKEFDEDIDRKKDILDAELDSGEPDGTPGTCGTCKFFVPSTKHPGSMLCYFDSFQSSPRYHGDPGTTCYMVADGKPRYEPRKGAGTARPHITAS